MASKKTPTAKNSASKTMPHFQHKYREQVRLLLVSGILLFTPLFSFASDGQGTVEAASIIAWKQFRAAQPFQTQVIALSQAPGGKPRTLILSEPAPQMTQARLMAILGTHAAGCKKQEWTVMSGGIVSDLVCTVVKTNQPDWPETLAQIQLEALGSTEGAPVISLPVPVRKMLGQSMDVRFTANDLYNWLVNDKHTFSSNPISPSLILSDLLTGGTRGVFRSDDGQLIIWIVGRNAVLDERARGDIHRFAVGGDLILGAVANKQSVVIVGRARTASLAHLPPLRSETILLLAGSSERQLEQSYERNDLIAGKGTDGIDRAPILLSPQLVDTEFGTLLNVADQLLKGWSMAGLVQYASFNYPKPRSYPFGATPAYKVEPGRDQFLFNWNTDGVAYQQAIGELDVIAPQRTGSLSVIYGDIKDRPRSMEDTAYEYFAQSGDTSLARVVQYTLLYQIFRQFNITAAQPPVSARYKEFTTRLDQVTRSQLKYLLSDVSEAQLKALISSYWTNFFGGTSDAELASYGIQRNELIANRVDVAMTVAQVLREANKTSNGKVLDALVDITEIFRLRSQPTAVEEARFNAALTTLDASLGAEFAQELLQKRGYLFKQTGLIQTVMSQPGGWNSLMSAGPVTATSNHTAYIVESHGQGSGVGGHNIDASITRFHAEESLSKGNIRVNQADNGDWVVDYSPADSDRVRAIARDLGTLDKDLSKEQIEAGVAQALNTALPEKPVTLSSIRKVTGHDEDFNPSKATAPTHQVRGLKPDERKVLDALAASKEDAIIIELSSNGAFTLMRTGSLNVMEVNSVTAATDALANGLIANAGGSGGVSVLVKGVAAEKTEAMLSTVKASLLHREKSSVDAVIAADSGFVVTPGRVKMLNGKIAHNGLYIDHSDIKTTKVKGGKFDGYTRVEVPIIVQSQAKWYLQLIFFVKDMSTASINAIVSKVSNVLATLNMPASPTDINSAIRHSLQKDFQELHIDALLKVKGNDASHKIHSVTIAQDMKHAKDNTSA
ncbi:hypothetical protein [Citrobacter enshiensis]|uniref:hypothetical protein n=1 Tax=Citrobacter enshiensis TaxID=2971264 RepID=UPI0023E81FCC|nr:hypothetical protein [Citrobacter enshiensis]WET39283.1 hypothetical protein P2W74_14960 [Citrobacter enshiensis]